MISLSDLETEWRERRFEDFVPRLSIVTRASFLLFHLAGDFIFHFQFYNVSTFFSLSRLTLFKKNLVRSMVLDVTVDSK